MYTVKEIFYTLQGEGFHTGRPSVFCRFSGCNLWTGREEDRHRAVCQFCDTDFVGVGPDGGKFAAAGDLAARVASLWPAESQRSSPYVVCTGGEPLLQLDEPLLAAFHALGFQVGVETNGTQPAPPGIDWICVSPKANADLKLVNGDELKLVFPQEHPEAQPERFEHLDFAHFLLQPMDGPRVSDNTRRTVEYCLAHPKWRLSLQTHKLLGLR